ncbi:MAG: PEP-CTERM sorting domain-containing protein [Phycisphaerae bacterium]|nr:PEP-CTERM sorting domain-containing protein [Phycisphaerae bacterium]
MGRLLFFFLLIAGMVAPAALAENVLWDTSHGVFEHYAYTPSGGYSQLESQLTGMGFTIDVTDAGFLTDDPADYDVIVVNQGSSWDTAYTPEEVTKIADFVNAGGGLLLMGDNAASPSENIRPVADAFGLDLSLSTITPWATTTSLLTPHPIFQGVDTIAVYAAGEISGGTIVGRQEGTDTALVSVLTPGLGRVTLLGDCDAFTNDHRWEADNINWTASTFQWLAIPEPATLSLLAFAGLVAAKRRR